MDSPVLSCDQLLARIPLGGGERDGEAPVLLVDLDGAAPSAGELGLLADALTSWPWVVVGVGPPHAHGSPLAGAVDAVFAPDDPALATLVTQAAAHPAASISLALLLRSAGANVTPPAGLVAESAAYSMLQSGADFQTWLQGRRRPRTPADEFEEPDDAVVVVEHGADLHLVLNRPARHNAIDRRMRIELHDALRVAALRPAGSVVLRGAGPSFSSGGDLAEFGSFRDPAESHLVRLRNHPAVALLALPPSRAVARVHGAVVGGGLELAAFCARVVAHPDAWFQLPEVALGLIPGAGGTVSVTRRIGRQRTARMAITGERVDAPTALAWGLVDEVAGPADWEGFSPRSRRS